LLNIKRIKSSVEKCNRELLNIENSIDISNLLYKRDNLLCKLIEESNPPYYLKHNFFNYKAILIYFMRNFYSNIEIQSSDINAIKVKEKLFKNQNKITIQTPINSLFHLINIPNEHIKEYHEQIIYDLLKFKNYGNSNNHFESKIASIGWLKETLCNPDLIYDTSAKKSKKIKFDFLFVRETGLGTESQKYMYHVVALKDIKYNRFTIISQFPLGKDRKRSKGQDKVSMLHTKVECSKPIFRREGIELPKDGINIDNLIYNLGGF